MEAELAVLREEVLALRAAREHAAAEVAVDAAAQSGGDPEHRGAPDTGAPDAKGPDAEVPDARRAPSEIATRSVQHPLLLALAVILLGYQIAKRR